jgi:cation transport ATPase
MRSLSNQIDEVHAGLKPEDKHRLVQELKQRGAKVAVAGDGINDAPALAAADVRIATGTGNGCGDSERRTHSHRYARRGDAQRAMTT